MNYIGATMTLDSSPYTISEMLLLLLLQQLPIASAARLIWQQTLLRRVSYCGAAVVVVPLLYCHYLARLLS